MISQSVQNIIVRSDTKGSHCSEADCRFDSRRRVCSVRSLSRRRCVLKSRRDGRVAFLGGKTDICDLLSHCLREYSYRSARRPRSGLERANKVLTYLPFFVFVPWSPTGLSLSSHDAAIMLRGILHANKVMGVREPTDCGSAQNWCRAHSCYLAQFPPLGQELDYLPSASSLPFALLEHSPIKQVNKPFFFLR